MDIQKLHISTVGALKFRSSIEAIQNENQWIFIIGIFVIGRRQAWGSGVSNTSALKRYHWYQTAEIQNRLFLAIIILFIHCSYMCGKSAAEKYSSFGKVEFIKQMKPCRNNIDLKATFGMVQIKFLHGICKHISVNIKNNILTDIWKWNIDRYMIFLKNDILIDICRNFSFFERYMKIFIFEI